MGEVDKRYGKGVIGTAGQMLLKKVPRIPFGITPLDIDTGGGVPGGRMTLLWGDESSGKTTLAKRLVGNSQKLCSLCFQPYIIVKDKKKCTGCGKYREFVSAWMDVEGAFDPPWAKMHGIDSDRLLYANPEYAEQCVDIVDSWLRTGDVDMIVIDSLAALTPAEEVEKSVEDNIVGTHAKLLNSAMRKWVGALNFCGRKFKRRPTIIAIQQVRYKIGVMWGSPDTIPGGKGQKFAASMIVKTWHGEVETIGDAKVPQWVTKRYHVEKNKVSPPHKRGEFSIAVADMDGGKRIGDILEEEFVFKQMKDRGMFQFEKEGGKIILMGEERLNGKGQVIKHWMDSPEIFKTYKQDLLKHLGVA